MCLACVDEGLLSLETFNKIDAFTDEWPESEYGPAHIVLSDDNLADGHLDWCIALCKGILDHDDISDPEDREFLERMEYYSDHDRDEIQATLNFLQELRAIPEDVR